MDITKTWDASPTDPANNSVDSYGEMMSRKKINDVWPRRPMDFYDFSIMRGIQDGVLDNDARVVVIGGNSCESVLKATQHYHIQPEIVCVDPFYSPYGEPLADFLKGKGLDPSRLRYLKDFGEDIGLPDNFADLVIAHNVFFRAKDLTKMIAEAIRVGKPDSYLMPSTNFTTHAALRHACGRVLSEKVKEELGIDFPAFKPPAFGAFGEDVPRLVDKFAELKIISEPDRQYTDVEITEGERFDTFLDALLFEGKRYADVKAQKAWRRHVAETIAPQLIECMPTDTPPGETPFFTDTVHRAMYTIRVNK